MPVLLLPAPILMYGRGHVCSMSIVRSIRPGFRPGIGIIHPSGGAPGGRLHMLCITHVGLATDLTTDIAMHRASVMPAGFIIRTAQPLW